jgi:hypothetical protein
VTWIDGRSVLTAISRLGRQAREQVAAARIAQRRRRLDVLAARDILLAFRSRSVLTTIHACSSKNIGAITMIDSQPNAKLAWQREHRLSRDG